MSKTTIIVICVVVALLVAGGIWWWSMSTANAPSSPAAYAPSAPPAAMPTQTQGTNTAPAQAPTLAATGTSDAALNADLSQIDSQMNGMSGDNASINQGLTDQPVQQQQL